MLIVHIFVDVFVEWRRKSGGQTIISKKKKQKGLRTQVYMSKWGEMVNRKKKFQIGLKEAAKERTKSWKEKTKETDWEKEKRRERIDMKTPMSLQGKWMKQKKY